MKGRAKRWKVTKADAGLPGSPNTGTGARPSMGRYPKPTGLPGEPLAPQWSAGREGVWSAEY